MNVLQAVRNELNRLGYAGNLLQEDYVFDDASVSGTKDLNVPLAAFAQWPPSYRNACIGVLTANGQSGPQHVSGYGTLGAPMFFEVLHDCLDRYSVESPGQARFIESISVHDIHRAFEVNREKWAPDTIFRAKAITPITTPTQLDFVDIGFLPALKGMIHGKLDRLLRDILQKALIAHEEVTSGKPDETLLFRLVFRFLAAKIFKDKKHPGNWAVPQANTIIQEIQRFYELTAPDMQKVLDEPNTQQIIWDRFQNAFNFQNISVDDLAFIYENTLIRKETRKRFGVHSTPSVIAELMVDRLPFESLLEHERFIIEPFAGHGVFLVAALRRLRELLPVSLTDEERHKYLRDRLTAIEVDTFAAEVCRLSLMLADYPNPNGWQIIPEDVFASDILDKQLETSQIVLCNPPFEDFTPQEREHYRDKIQSSGRSYTCHESSTWMILRTPDIFWENYLKMTFLPNPNPPACNVFSFFYEIFVLGIFFSTSAPTIYPATSDPVIVNTVSIATYKHPKYAIIIGRRNGLTALLFRKTAMDELPAPFSFNSLSIGYQA